MKEKQNQGMFEKPPFFLREIYNVPFSLNHNRDVFVFMLKNGLFQQVKIHCLRISQKAFEKMITEYPLLIEAHVDFYSNMNEYWLGRDNIDDDQIEIYLMLREDSIKWFFIQLIDEPRL